MNQRNGNSKLKVKNSALRGIAAFLMFNFSLPFVFAAPAPNSDAGGRSAVPEEMEVKITGQFKGRLLVKKIIAPITMNLEKLQDFPEDPSQKILLDPLPISQAGEFNARSEIKGHAPFVPWVPAISEPPFLRMVPPKLSSKHLPQSWMFEVFNPQGQTIFRQRGTNELPDELIWEGKDSEKKYAIVDRLYSAQLTLVDANDQATVISGDSIVLPAMVYGSAESETVEISLARLFTKDKPEISAEGAVLLAKFCERVREMSVNHMHVRIAGNQSELSAQRESVLVSSLSKALRVPPQFLEHDHTTPTLRGEIAVFWIKRGGAQ